MGSLARRYYTSRPSEADPEECTFMRLVGQQPARVSCSYMNYRPALTRTVARSMTESPALLRRDSLYPSPISYIASAMGSLLDSPLLAFSFSERSPQPGADRIGKAWTEEGRGPDTRKCIFDGKPVSLTVVAVMRV
jgi:hypothetical protein